MASIVIIGAGIGGLGSAMCLGRAGHAVTVIERDDTPLPADPDAAFEWQRTGAPQVRHTHAFLARLRNLLRDRYPDVLATLLDTGATEMDFISMMPEGMDRSRVDGDDDLVALSCRRTTFEWVLRRVVATEARVELLHGVSVEALVGTPTTPGAPARVTGVRLDDGRELSADMVIDAGGRRSPVAARLAALGVEVDETEEDTGIVYFSRFYHLNEGREPPPQVGPIGGDLGYLKYGVFLGDRRTFSITLAAQAHDDLLRTHLRDPATFERVAAQLPATRPFVIEGLASPISDVNVMARLVNRSRTFTDPAGEPLVAGYVALGDAHTCSNPLYGRGCSLAIVQAQLLTDAWAAHPHDVAAVGRDYEAGSAAEVVPWYRAAVAQDAATRADHAGAPGGDEHPLRGLLRDGILPAMRTDPVVLRAFLRMFNLLTPPDALFTDLDVIGRVWRCFEMRDERPPEEPLGPARDALLAAIDLPEGASPTRTVAFEGGRSR